MMDVLALCPLRPAAFTWRPARGGHALTVVCKATFSLTVGEAQLAPQQVAPTEHDRYHDDNPAASLYLPTDLVPFKPRADVLLTGSAYAPRGQPARSLPVQLTVGNVNKSFLVVGPRVVGDGEWFGEPAPFESMPLRWERAAGGPGTVNPIGARAGVAPNLLPGTATLADPRTPVDPVGFGPIAPAWPGRADKLGGVPPTWMREAWTDQPLPASVEPSFFNVAPPDQQCNPLRPGETLMLKGLRPDIPQFVTRLPGLAPRCFVHRTGTPPQDVPMTCDTLLIDTDRGICMLTFRGQVSIDSPRFAGRIIVAMERPGQTLSWADVERMKPELRATPGIPREPVIAVRGPTVEETIQQSDFRAPAALPFAGGAAPPPPVQGPVPPPSMVPLLATPFSSAPSPPSSPSAMSAPPLLASAPIPPEPLPVSPAGPSPWASGVPAGALGVKVASDAAAVPWTRPREAPPSLRTASPADEPQATGQDVLYLIWFDTASVRRIRRQPSWRKIILDLAQKPVDEDLDDSVLADQPEDAEDRRELLEVFAEASANDATGIEEAVSDGIRNGKVFVAPLKLIAGDLLFPFDELETLKATVTTVTPLVGSDEQLRATLVLAYDFLKLPDLRSAPAVAEGITTRIRDAFARGKRTVPQDYLDSQTERVLLTQRHYQRRAVFGKPHLRALMQPAGSAHQIPAYLPDTLAQDLPMYLRFGARVIAEVHPQVDQYESHQAALRIVGLARIVFKQGR